MAKEKKIPIEDRAVQRIMRKVDAEFKATGGVSKDTAGLATVIVLGSVMRRLDRVIERLDSAGRRPRSVK